MVLASSIDYHDQPKLSGAKCRGASLTVTTGRTVLLILEEELSGRDHERERSIYDTNDGVRVNAVVGGCDGRDGAVHCCG